MGFHVDYDALDGLYHSVHNHAFSWSESLVALNDSFKTLIASRHMSGFGAASVQSYFENVHQAIIACIGQLLALHESRCLLYVGDYHSKVDPSLHAVIDEAELEEISGFLSVQAGASQSIDDETQAALNSVSDLISAACPGFDNIQDKYQRIDTFIRNLREAILTLEDEHYRSDFAETERMISSLRSVMRERLDDVRTYKLDFNANALANDPSFLALAQSYVALSERLEAEQDAIKIAAETENRRIEALQAEAQEEYERRQRNATIWKWAVAGLCIVVSTAIIIGSAGTATPLVVGSAAAVKSALFVGAVSAGSGAVIAANNVGADEYVKHGWNTDQWDWGSIGGNALLGGASGFVTGFVGAGLTQGISTTLSAAGNAYLNSSSMAVRIGANAFIGSSSQVVSGIVSRGAASFATTWITSGDLEKSWNAATANAFNLQSVAFDGALGAFFGGVRGVKKPQTGNGLSYDQNELVKELERNNVKFTKDDIVFITRDKTGQIVWLETGSPNAGLEHLLHGNGHTPGHASQFAKAFGVEESEVPDFLRKVVSQGDVVSDELKMVGGRLGYERIYSYQGSKCVLTGIGENGFIVTAYPYSN